MVKQHDVDGVAVLGDMGPNMTGVTEGWRVLCIRGQCSGALNCGDGWKGTHSSSRVIPVKSEDAVRAKVDPWNSEEKLVILLVYGDVWSCCEVWVSLCFYGRVWGGLYFYGFRLGGNVGIGSLGSPGGFSNNCRLTEALGGQTNLDWPHPKV